MSWTSKQRLLAALRMEIPDRLPVTTHHVMPFFLRNAMNGMSVDEFFDDFGMDPIRWIVAHKPDESRGDYIDPKQGRREFLQPPRISAAGWRIETVRLPHPDYKTVHYTIVTPEKTLSMTLQSDDHTTWVTERLIKEKSDVETFAKYAPIPLCDVEEVNRQVTAQGEKGLIRGTVPGFDIYGQPGCWQDAAVLFGIERLILETYDDPEWVHTFLAILRDRKKIFIRSMKGAKFDLVELGGGDASSTVISPKIFDEFVALYDADLIEAAHQAGQKIVYHTCGGMMPLLESLADMNPDAVETFTPLALGGDTNLKEAKRSVASATASASSAASTNFITSPIVRPNRRVRPFVSASKKPAKTAASSWRHRTISSKRTSNVSTHSPTKPEYVCTHHQHLKSINWIRGTIRMK